MRVSSLAGMPAALSRDSSLSAFSPLWNTPACTVKPRLPVGMTPAARATMVCSGVGGAGVRGAGASTTVAGLAEGATDAGVGALGLLWLAAGLLLAVAGAVAMAAGMACGCVAGLFAGLLAAMSASGCASGGGVCGLLAKLPAGVLPLTGAVALGALGEGVCGALAGGISGVASAGTGVTGGSLAGAGVGSAGAGAGAGSAVAGCIPGSACSGLMLGPSTSTLGGVSRRFSRVMAMATPMMRQMAMARRCIRRCRISACSSISSCDGGLGCRLGLGRIALTCVSAAMRHSLCNLGMP